MTTASFLNNIEQPPRLTGDSGRDTVAVIQWLNSFYVKAILSGGLLQPQNMDPSLVSLGDLVSVGDQLAYYTAEDTFDLTGLTSFARSILDDEDAATVRATIGAGTVTGVTGTAPISSSGGNTPDISIADFVASGAAHASGAVPDPGAAAGTTKFLREDATFAVPPGLVEVTAQAVGFTITNGATPKTLTVALDASVAGTNTGDLNMSPITNSLSGDVALNNTANFFDGPRIAQGTTGTWFVSGTVTLSDTVGAAGCAVKLWDGTTVVASGMSVVTGAGLPITVSLSGYIASPAGDLRMSVRDFGTTTGLVKFNNSGNSKDSTITAIRIA